MTESEIKEKISKLQRFLNASGTPEAFKDQTRVKIEAFQKELDALAEKKPEPKNEEPKKEPETNKSEPKPKKAKSEKKDMSYDEAMAILKKDPERLKKDCETILARDVVRKEDAKESKEKYESKSGGAKIVGAAERLADGIAREAKSVKDKGDLRKLVSIIKKTRDLVSEAKKILEGRNLSKEETEEFEGAIAIINKYLTKKFAKGGTVNTFHNSTLESDYSDFPDDVETDIDSSNNPNGKFVLVVSLGDDLLGEYYYDSMEDAEHDQGLLES